jgi:23S rRNA pseudouridine1911/1915/1917 synthase
MQLKEKTRLIRELQAQFPGISRSEAKKLLATKSVSKEGDTVSLTNRENIVKDLNRKRHKETSKLIEEDLNLEVAYEDKNTIIVNKPRGITVHRDNQNPISLKEHIEQYIIKSSDNPFAEIQPVNRLDKETSGLVMYSKNLKAHGYYSRLFKTHNLTKKYLAVVQISEKPTKEFNELISQKEIRIQNYISKMPRNRKYYCTTELQGDYAETIVKIKKENTGKTLLLELEPKTGRTHQLRVHLSEIGIPIVGDSIYNPEFKKDKEFLKLHSYFLQFIPYGEGKFTTIESLPEWIKG